MYSIPANTRHGSGVGLMPGQRHRRWPASVQHPIHVSCLLGDFYTKYVNPCSLRRETLAEICANDWPTCLILVRLSCVDSVLSRRRTHRLNTEPTQSQCFAVNSRQHHWIHFTTCLLHLGERIWVGHGCPGQSCTTMNRLSIQISIQNAFNDRTNEVQASEYIQKYIMLSCQ